MERPPFTEKDFEDIRPYRDWEIRGVLNQIRQHPWIVSALRRFFWPNMPDWMVPTAEAVLKFYLRLRLIRIHTVDDWHFRFFRKTVLQWIEERTMSELTYEGTEHIPRERGNLFITNHRDIVLDSAFLSYGLMKIGMRTPEIAFGDNLLVNKFVSDMIRINKGFLVKRNVEPQKQLSESRKLSNYIWYTLVKGRHIWLAQKGGRAKDGNDLTNPTIIKMVYLSQVKGGINFSDFINECSIIPVSISYEYDPCDRMKAREVYYKRTEEAYKKSPREDLISILKGINESKGRVHFCITAPLSGTWKDPKEVAEAIDMQIIGNYRLWPTNYIAYDLHFNTDEYRTKYTNEEKEAFLKRLARWPEEIAKTGIEIYARPVINKREFESRK